MKKASAQKDQRLTGEKLESFLDWLDVQMKALSSVEKARELYKEMPQVKIKPIGIHFNRAAIKALHLTETVKLIPDLEKGILIVTPAAADEECSVKWASVQEDKISPVMIQKDNADMYSALNWNTDCRMGMHAKSQDRTDTLVFHIHSAYIAGTTPQ